MPATTKEDIIAIFVADLHIDTKTPPCRAIEPDWFEAQERYYAQLRNLQEATGALVFIAGDIFNTWNSQAEAISFALKSLPDRCCAIPGNHDLQFHNYENLKKSAYWTLVEAGKIASMEPGIPYTFEDTIFYGWPHGFEVKPADKNSLMRHVAIIHDYIWTANCGHGQADDSYRVPFWRKRLTDLGYNAAVFGDNHIGFMITGGFEDENCAIINCGAFIRRKADEVNNLPHIYTMQSSGQINRIPLDISQDKFVTKDNISQVSEILAAKPEIDFTEVLEILNAESESSADFAAAIRTYIRQNNIRPAVAGVILQAIGGC